jgi:hypothetical protein
MIDEKRGCEIKQLEKWTCQGLSFFAIQEIRLESMLHRSFSMHDNYSRRSNLRKAPESARERCEVISCEMFFSSHQICSHYSARMSRWVIKGRESVTIKNERRLLKCFTLFCWPRGLPEMDKLTGLDRNIFKLALKMRPMRWNAEWERDESFPGSFWLSRESLEVREESFWFHAVRDKPITRCKNWLQVKQNASSLIIPSNMIQLLLCALINILISSTWKASALPRAFRLFPSQKVNCARELPPPHQYVMIYVRKRRRRWQFNHSEDWKRWDS